MAAPPPDRPHGRDDVVAAILAAATRLFAAHGPNAVSLRDVAIDANVNLGLIHRYVGGKQDLLAAVLASRPGMTALDTAPLATPEEIADQVLQLLASDPAYIRILMRAALDGFDVVRLQVRFPLIARAARATRAELASVDADARIAFIATALLGWHAVSALVLGALDQRSLDGASLARALRPALVAFLMAEPEDDDDR